jgi:predicted NUDIX family NTP pyrophosphohydrolase
VLSTHPGGPSWQNKSDGAWSIPKGEIETGEELLTAARREFAEETGFTPNGLAVSLGSLHQADGKSLHVWAIEEDWDPEHLISNTFSIEWPPRSGRVQRFPEIDRAAWFDVATAHKKILKARRNS